MKRIATLLSLALLLALAGCNTVRGLGQDISNAGTAIENAVKK